MAQNYSTLTTMIIVPPFCSFNCTHSRSSLIDQSLHLKITNIYPSSPSVILEQNPILSTQNWIDSCPYLFHEKMNHNIFQKLFVGLLHVGEQVLSARGRLEEDDRLVPASGWLSMWPDLAKFHYFGMILKTLAVLKGLI